MPLYYVANLENRTILTYKAGDMLAYGNRELVAAAAAHAQELTGAPHAVVDESVASAVGVRLKGLAVAPWLV